MMTEVASSESAQKLETGKGLVVDGVVKAIIADVSEGESGKQRRPTRRARSERKCEVEERRKGNAGQR